MPDTLSKGQRFLLGSLILIGLPLTVLLALAAYVHIRNAAPQSGPLTVAVKPQVVLPWQQAHFLTTVTGHSVGDAATVEPVDIVFAIDVSGSMESSLPTMAAAAREAARQVSAGKGGAVRFALVPFDTEAEISVPWTSNPDVLFAGLENLRPFTSHNDSRAMFLRLDELFATSRPGAKRAVVFYTDGDMAECSLIPQCLGGPSMSYAQIGEAGERLRSTGLDLFCVGRPGGEVHRIMSRVTGTSSHIFTPSDMTDLAANFDALAAAVTGMNQSGAQISHRLDGRYFSAPLEGTRWILDPTGSLRLDIGRLPMAPKTFGHPLTPRSAGLWQVGTKPVLLTYVDDSGHVLQVHASSRPRMLVVTWMVLLLPLLPWLLWLLFQLPPRATKFIVEPLQLPVRAMSLPTALPALPRQISPAQPVPTLFVGLGGAGIEALRAIRADLKQLHLATAPQPYQFLALDLDKRPPDPSRFDEWEEQPIHRIAASREVVHAGEYLPRVGETAAHLGWFDAARYEHAARENLNLDEGSQGDRMLARLALFQWLAAPETPMRNLERGVEALMATPFACARQIVVAASPDGGVGSGWFADVARLLRRVSRSLQDGSELIPEIVGVLVATQGTTRTDNRAALRNELESIALTGEFPRKVVIHPDRPLLSARDTESPFDWIIEVSDSDAASTVAQSGALASLLCQRNLRGALLGAAGKQKLPATVMTSGVHVVSTLARDHVQIDLLLRLLGPDLLMDIVPAKGGYEVRKAAPEELQQALEEWLGKEPPGTPLQRMLSLAVDPSLPGGALPAFSTSVDDVDPAATAEWVEPALRTSVNRLLQGYRDSGSGAWMRNWYPGLGAAALSLFAERLGELSGLTPSAGAAVESARAWAVAVSERLDEWLRELAAVAKHASARKRALATQLDFVRLLRHRSYLDAAVEPKAIVEASRVALERWLRTVDTLSPLRERLFFAAERDRSIVLRSFVKSPQTMTAAETALSLTEITTALASTVPSLQISSALSVAGAAEFEELAAGMVDHDVRPDLVILAAPELETPPSARDAEVERYRRSVPQPAAHGQRRDLSGGDRSAIRRVAIASSTTLIPESAEPLYIETAERESEQLRFRIRQRYSVRVPPFPVRLRIAVADPSRFRLFARAYREGRIVRKDDESGGSRWYDVDRSTFLTFGGQSDLAAAAANYVWFGGAPGAMPVVVPGNFFALDNWLSGEGDPGPDGIVLAAVRIAEEG